MGLIRPSTDRWDSSPFPAIASGGRSPKADKPAEDGVAYEGPSGPNVSGRYDMSKAKDKKRTDDKKKAQKSLKEKRAAKKAKKAEKASGY